MHVHQTGTSFYGTGSISAAAEIMMSESYPAHRRHRLALMCSQLVSVIPHTSSRFIT